MDGQQFDRFAKSMASGISRRRALKTVAGAIVGGLGVGRTSRAQQAPACNPTDTSVQCSGHGTCLGSGECLCNSGYAGASCDECASNRYNYPICTYCDPVTTCSGNGRCNSASGACICDQGYTGDRCASCADSYWGPDCTYCLAAITCSGQGTCNSATGACDCRTGYAGANCNQCDAEANYYGSPPCIFCDPETTCSSHGSCNSATGACFCDEGYTGPVCSIPVCPGGCSHLDGPCTEGFCDTSTNPAQCVALPVNGACDDLNACTGDGICQNGVCQSGETTVVCTATDACHTAGICDPSNGLCSPEALTAPQCKSGRIHDGPCDCDGTCCPVGYNCVAEPGGRRCKEK